MLVAAVLCLSAAVVAAASGVWSLTRRPTDDYVHQVLRAVAPTQLAAAVMLGAGAVVALTATPPMSVVILVVCTVGAVGTVGAGCWQAAAAVARRNAAHAGTAGGCGSSDGTGCATCTLSCGPSSG
ncbi:hypothetical protein CRI77_24515 [Mycolicibacterium duvalii]|uniref:Uncharacterized protein n=1 Tax=Mycolicibacterium duvalii TaxID=39688 RepID=A0A7I7K7P1_9MYCO|nr:hypothetical protein [Mycolicibacterium duvalii]MCV7365988.1 hypothetical protein [Mycolicibacterium duvalii]PEG35865.1 hypothetical protein CRI77_24515 [Mycolicibacterium duvalii]BBX19432.1 hypothetical protein MDUV_42920 [Mycolicibacterium duvalii]